MIDYSIDILIGFLLSTSTIWAFQYFGLSCFEQIVFHLKVPLEGTNTQFIFDWIKMCFIKSILITCVFCLIYFIESMHPYLKYIGILILLLNLIYSAIKVGLVEFILNLFRSTDIYDQYYVDGKNVNIEFPSKKRNLIYIYLESMENTYSSKENGGDYKEDLIPELSNLAFNNFHFSNTDKLGGAHVVSGTGWTTGGIVGQSGGVPLLVPFTIKRFSDKTPFLKGAYTLGDILEKEGYNQEYLIGSNAYFGGRKFYFDKHGHFKIFDLDEAKKENKLDKDYRVFWGYEDAKLFAFAKDEITRLSKEDKPFNFTMLSVDTHHPYGYKDTYVKDEYKEGLSNIIKGSSKKCGEFIKWLQEQPFYEDTTIIITGDHTSMAAEYILGTYDKKYDRTIYNCFINSQNTTNHNLNRDYTSFDMYPTTLSALGVKIEGNKLGLGTNLFSDEKTLTEKIGFHTLDVELRKQSKYYKNKIL